MKDTPVSTLYENMFDVWCSFWMIRRSRLAVGQHSRLRCHHLSTAPTSDLLEQGQSHHISHVSLSHILKIIFGSVIITVLFWVDFISRAVFRNPSVMRLIVSYWRHRHFWKFSWDILFQSTGSTIHSALGDLFGSDVFYELNLTVLTYCLTSAYCIACRVG